MNYREKIREQINKYPYGEYYGLKPNQPKDIIRLLNEMDRADKVIKHQFFEIERLNNIINELEKWLDEKINESNLKGCSFEQTYITGKWNAYKKSLNKLKELKEGK